MHPSKLINGPGLDLSPAGLELAAERMLSLPQVDMPLRHHFAEGVCVRELTIPAGTLVLGQVHRYPEINIMLTGRLTLLNEGGTTTELRAPQTFLAPPGQKIAYVHEETIWQNVWPTGGFTNSDVDLVDALENYYLDKSPALGRHLDRGLSIERLARSAERDAYAGFLKRHALTETEVRRMSEITDDLMLMPSGSWKVRVGESAIEGKGLFATAPIRQGEVIAPARVAGKRTPAGRYTNHSDTPNAAMGRCAVGNKDKWELFLIATEAIGGAHGGLPGEEITVNYSQVLEANDELAALLANQKQ